MKLKQLFLVPALILALGACGPDPDNPTKLEIQTTTNASEVEIDDTINFKAILDDEQIDNNLVLWSSSKTNIGTIDKNGIFSAVALGTTTITGTYKEDISLTADFTITVVAEIIVPTSITIVSSTGSFTINDDEAMTLSVTTTPANASKSVVWKSSNHNVLTLDNSGVVTIIGTGTSKVSATSSYNTSIISPEQTITVVKSLAGESITLVPPSSTVFEVGQTADFSATVTSGLASANVRYKSSATSVATINETTGALSANKVGTSVITAYYLDNPEIKDTVSIEVVAQIIAPESITLSSAVGDTIPTGSKSQISVSAVSPAGASKSVTWSTSNTSRATISATGLLTAVGVGSVIVYGTSTVNTSIKGQLTLTISEAPAGYYKADSFTMNASQFKAHWGPTEQMLDSTGTQKILVIPVKFSDGPSWTSSMLTRLNKAFFGASSDTGWESVASYYNKSSYGALTITGQVTDVLNMSMTVSNADAKGEALPEDYVAPQFYSTTSVNLKEYDQNNDGYVDAACFIYSNDYYDDSAYWAWVWNRDIDSNASKPQISNYMWASYEFMSDGYGSSSVDAHTYIHEFGHILGLDDYYSRTTYNPTGSWVMMANNVLDQDPYSKMLKGWAKPYVVDGTASSTSITIQPFESSGDFILVKNNWNGSPIDEYMLIELYTATGLNYQDATSGYNNSLPKNTFTSTGIRIWHIDSRGVEVNYNGSFQRYITSASQLGSGYYGIGASNLHTSYSLLESPYNSTFKLIHLMEATGSNSFKSGGSATNNTTFKQGSSFTASSTFFPNGTNFNDGSAVGYRIEMTTVNSSAATITIVKL